jgi:hypothetical protein
MQLAQFPQRRLRAVGGFLAQFLWRDQHAVLVTVDPFARPETDTTELHGDVRLAFPFLRAFRGVDVMTPAQPLSRARAASMSPIRAIAVEPPPSTTMTPPSPGSPSSCRNSTLSWKHLTVRILPKKRLRPPKSRNWMEQVLQVSSKSS